MIENVEGIKEYIFKKIKTLNIDDLVSVVLIGSFQYLRKLEKYNDVDLVIFVKKLTPELFIKINKEFKKIAKKIKYGKIKTIVENRMGPVKTKPKSDEILIQLHLLIYDISTYKKNIRDPILFDINNFSKKLYGKDPKKIKDIKKLGKKSLLQDLEIHTASINSKTAYIGKYIIEKNKLSMKPSHIKLSKTDTDELNSYHIIMSFLNLLRYKNYKTKKNKKDILIKGKKLLPKKYLNILKNSFEIKEKIRKGKKLNKKESQDLKKQAIEFIKYLRKAYLKI